MDIAFTLQQLAEVTRGKLFASEESAALEISFIGTDTRKDLRASVFLALKGESFDGHAFIEQAIAAGAKALIIHNRDLVEEYKNHIPLILVSDTLVALQDIARAYRDLLNSIVIAVTGSVGKTSTRDIIATCLETQKIVHRTTANLNNTIGVPFCIFDMKKETEIAIVEMGMDTAGEMRSMSYTSHPEITVITNIGTSHIEHFNNRKELALEKADVMKEQKENGPLFINAEDRYLLQIAEEVAENRPVYFIHTEGLGKYLSTQLLEDDAIPEANQERINHVASKAAAYTGDYLFDGLASGTQIFCSNVMENASGLSFDCYTSYLAENRKKIGTVRMMKPEISQMQNALFGLAISLVLNIDIHEAISSLRDVKLTSARQQIEKLGEDGFLIDDSYNASPESMRAAFHLATVLGENAHIHHKVAIIGGVNELGSYAEELHRDIGVAAAKSSFDSYYILGPWAKIIREGILSENESAEVYCFEEQADLIEAIHKVPIQQTLFLVKASRGYFMEHVCQAIRQNQNL